MRPPLTNPAIHEPHPNLRPGLPAPALTLSPLWPVPRSRTVVARLYSQTRLVTPDAGRACLPPPCRLCSAVSANMSKYITVAGLIFDVLDMATTVAALSNALISGEVILVSVLLGLCALSGVFRLVFDTFLLCKFGAGDGASDRVSEEGYPPSGSVFAVFGEDLAILCVEVARGRGMLSTQSPVDVLSGAVSAIMAGYTGCKVMGQIIRGGIQEEGFNVLRSWKLIVFLLVTAVLGLYTAGRWASTADTDEAPEMYLLFALFQVVGFITLASVCPSGGEDN